MAAESDLDPEFYEVVPKSKALPTPRRGSRLLTALACGAAALILLALLLPFHRGSARPAARRAWCMNNLKQIALALHNYVDRYQTLPPAHTVDANGQPLHSWRTLILPYLEQEALYRTIDLSKPWNDPVNARALATEVPVFRCPEESGRPTATTYLAITGPNACFRRTEGRRLDEITDGTSRTLMVIEADRAHEVPWMYPIDADESVVLRMTEKSRLNHAGGTNGAFVDGSVRFLKTSIPGKIRRALITIAGGELFSDDDW